MKLKIQFPILFIIASLCCYTGYTQDNKYVTYYNICSEARYHYHTGRYNESIALLNKAFAIPGIDTNSMDKFCMALCYSKLGKYKLAVDWYEQCLSKTAATGFLQIRKQDDGSFIITDKGFEFLKNEEKLADRVSLLLQDFVNRVRADKKLGEMRDSAQYFFVNKLYYSPGERSTALQITILTRYIDTAIGSYKGFEQKVVDFIIRHHEVVDIVNYGTELFTRSYIELAGNNSTVDSIVEAQFYAGKLSPATHGLYLERKYFCNKDSLNLVYKGYTIISPYCPKENWAEAIENRKRIGLGIYLDNEDYNANSFIFQRDLLPWQVWLAKNK